MLEQEIPTGHCAEPSAAPWKGRYGVAYRWDGGEDRRQAHVHVAGVDKEGVVLDAVVQKRRNKAATLKLLRKLLKQQGFVPDKFVTDGLASYKAAMEKLGSGLIDQSQKMTVAARTMAEKKAVAQRS